MIKELNAYDWLRFLAYSSGHKEANYIGPISHENIYPYVNFSEWFKDAEILIPIISISGSKCYIKRNFWREKN